MQLKKVRQVFIAGLPLLFIVASSMHFFAFANQWLEPFYRQAFYTIALTANIGYFTNYVAIKMLFKPYYPTAFGRQGLIPKNQNKLADSLSQTIIDNFLSKQQWQDYLTHSDIVNKVMLEARDGSSNWLNKPENINQLSRFLAEYLDTHKQSINHYLSQLQSEVVSEFTTQIDAQELLSKGFGWLEKQFEQNPSQMHRMIEPIIKSVAENIPDIADSLVKALDDHIEEQDTIKRGFAKMAKWSADFSVDDIKHYLFRMVASFEFRETLFDGLRSLLQEYQNRPILFVDDTSLSNNNDAAKEQLSMSNVINKLLDSNLTSIDWAQLFIDKINVTDSSNSNLSNNDLLKSSMLSIHSDIFDRIESELSNGPLHHWIIDELVSMIEKLDLRQLVKNKASEFSPKKMEQVFQNMISEQLVFIELLGAVLGALSGLALVDVRLFGALTFILASYYGLDTLLTYRQKLNRSDIAAVD